MAPERFDRPWTPKTDVAGKIQPGETEAASSQPAARHSYTLPRDLSALEMPTQPPDVNSEHTYSLIELIDLAESHNPLTAMAWNAAREVALAAGIAKSAYLPRLTAAAVGGHQTNTSQLSASSLSHTNNTQGEGAITSLSMNWLLFDFGQRSAIVEAAEQATVVANIGFNAAHQDLIHAVSVAFYTHSAAEARVKLAQQSLKNAESVQQAAEARLLQGVGTSIEVGKAQQGTAQAKLIVVQTEGAAKSSYQALLSALGVSPLTRLKIEDISGRKLDTAMLTSVDKIITEAISRRPDILAAYASEKAAKATVAAAEADFLPKIFLSGTGSYTNGGLYLSQIPSIGNQSSIGNFGSSGFGATIFGGISLSLYDGGMKAAFLSQANAKADNATLNVTQKRNQAVKEIVVAQNTLQTGVSTYEAATAMVKASELTFDAALTAYQSGAGSITDVMLAETQLLQAKIASTEAHSASLSAAATLALATGSMDSLTGAGDSAPLAHDSG